MFENFCANHVFNILVADYAECCEKLEGNRSIELETKHKKAVYHDEFEQVLVKDTREALIT